VRIGVPIIDQSASTACLCPADLLLFTATANTSIVTLNLSLMLNKVGFYQVRNAHKRSDPCFALKLPLPFPPLPPRLCSLPLPFIAMSTSFCLAQSTKSQSSSIKGTLLL